MYTTITLGSHDVKELVAAADNRSKALSSDLRCGMGDIFHTIGNAFIAVGVADATKSRKGIGESVREMARAKARAKAKGKGVAPTGVVAEAFKHTEMMCSVSTEGPEHFSTIIIETKLGRVTLYASFVRADDWHAVHRMLHGVPQ